MTDSYPQGWFTSWPGAQPPQYRDQVARGHRSQSLQDFGFLSLGHLSQSGPSGETHLQDDGELLGRVPVLHPHGEPHLEGGQLLREERAVLWGSTRRWSGNQRARGRHVMPGLPGRRPHATQVRAGAGGSAGVTELEPGSVNKSPVCGVWRRSRCPQLSGEPDGLDVLG